MVESHTGKGGERGIGLASGGLFTLEHKLIIAHEHVTHDFVLWVSQRKLWAAKQKEAKAQPQLGPKK